MSIGRTQNTYILYDSICITFKEETKLICSAVKQSSGCLWGGTAGAQDSMVSAKEICHIYFRLVGNAFLKAHTCVCFRSAYNMYPNSDIKAKPCSNIFSWMWQIWGLYFSFTQLQPAWDFIWCQRQSVPWSLLSHNHNVLLWSTLLLLCCEVLLDKDILPSKIITYVTHSGLCWENEELVACRWTHAFRYFH